MQVLSFSFVRHAAGFIIARARAAGKRLQQKKLLPRLKAAQY